MQPWTAAEVSSETITEGSWEGSWTSLWRHKERGAQEGGLARYPHMECQKWSHGPVQNPRQETEWARGREGTKILLNACCPGVGENRAAWQDQKPQKPRRSRRPRAGLLPSDAEGLMESLFLRKKLCSGDSLSSTHGSLYIAIQIHQTYTDKISPMQNKEKGIKISRSSSHWEMAAICKRVFWFLLWSQGREKWDGWQIIKINNSL